MNWPRPRLDERKLRRMFGDGCRDSGGERANEIESRLFQFASDYGVNRVMRILCAIN